MIRADAQIDKAAFKKWSKEFGDASNTALSRLAVSVSRELALQTKPPGRSKKKQVQSIIAGARANIVTVPPRVFRKIVNSRKPAYQFNHQWVSLRDDQILRNEKDIWDHIEKHRGGDGRVKRVSPRNRAICRKPDMTKVLVKRKKLAGVSKGSWIGAGDRAARFGKAVPKIGRNFLAWARKHADKGTAKLRKRMLGKSSIKLISKAPATKDSAILSRTDVKTSLGRAWSKTTKWYRKAARRVDK